MKLTHYLFLGLFTLFVTAPFTSTPALAEPSTLMAIPTELYSGFVSGDWNSTCQINSVTLQFIPLDQGHYRLDWRESGWLRGPRSGYCENRLDGTAIPTTQAGQYRIRFNWLRTAGSGLMVVDADQIEISTDLWSQNSDLLYFSARIKPVTPPTGSTRKKLRYDRMVRVSFGPDLDVSGTLTH